MCGELFRVDLFFMRACACLVLNVFVILILIISLSPLTIIITTTTVTAAATATTIIIIIIPTNILHHVNLLFNVKTSISLRFVRIIYAFYFLPIGVLGGGGVNRRSMFLFNESVHAWVGHIIVIYKKNSLLNLLTIVLYTNTCSTI